MDTDVLFAVKKYNSICWQTQKIRIKTKPKNTRSRTLFGDGFQVVFKNK